MRAVRDGARQDVSTRPTGRARVRQEWGHSQTGLGWWGAWLRAEAGKGATQARVLVAADEPDTERAAEAAGLSYTGRGVGGWGAAGAASLGLVAATGAQGSACSLLWREELRDSSKPSAGTEELTKPCGVLL